MSRQPEPYWVLDLGVFKSGRVSRCAWKYGRCFNKSKAEEIARDSKRQVHAVSADGSEVLVNNSAVVIAVTKRQVKQGRPIPLNTVNFLKACSKGLGIGPHSALQTAERLYLSGYLSYPRTESTAYPQSFDIRFYLEQ